MARFIVVAIWMNAYLDILFHMDSTTAQHMSSATEEIFIKKLRRFQYSLEFSKLHWKYRCKANHNALLAELRQPYFNYNQCLFIVLRAVVDEILKFVPVDVWAHGKQSNGGVFRNSDVYRSLEHEVCSCLKIQFCHLVKLHYLTFLLVTKRIA